MREYLCPVDAYGITNPTISIATPGLYIERRRPPYNNHRYGDWSFNESDRVAVDSLLETIYFQPYHETDIANVQCQILINIRFCDIHSWRPVQLLRMGQVSSWRTHLNNLVFGDT